MTAEEFFTPGVTYTKRVPFEELFVLKGYVIFPVTNVSLSNRSKHQRQGRGSLVPTRTPY